MGLCVCSFWEAKVLRQKRLLSSSPCCISSNSDMKPQSGKVSGSFNDDLAWRNGVDRSEIHL